MGVTVERRGLVAIVTLQREDKRNAIDAAMTEAIDSALNQLDDDPACSVIVLTGSRKLFCAGTDIVATAGQPTERGGEYGIIRRSRRKPIIAAVEGYAFGGGLEIVFACDLVVAATGSKFGLPEVKHSFVPTCGGMFRSLRLLPPNVARQLLLTGDPLDAERAYSLGLVNVLVAPGEALETAVALAERITANGPLAVRECLAAIEELHAAEEAQGWALTERASRVIWSSEDGKEGQRAFAEKRAPQWRGR